MEGRTPKVVYIAGWGRSGSTVLDQALGGIHGWFSCGELNFVWRNLQCGCGHRVHDCAFWRPVLGRTLDGDGLHPDEIVALQRAHLGPSPAALAAIVREARGEPTPGSPLRRYAELAATLYEVAAEAANARVLVDSTKVATDALLISALTDVDLYVVHLVRDPRATAYAWSKRKVKSSDPVTYFGRYPPARVGLHWLRRNLVIEALVRRRLGQRYLRLRYEDFVERPGAALRSICRLVGEEGAGASFVGERTLRVQTNHTVGGNPARFSSGELAIRHDEAWKAQLGWRSKALATLTAAPLMRRYGYSMLPPRARDNGGAPPSPTSVP